ncbi:MAG: HK97-gp10 family putative phage morphogenesis protein [Aliihoeflea sp.]
MSGAFTFKADGFDRLDRQLARLAKPTVAQKREALRLGAEIIADEMRRLAPVRSGRLRDSITVKVIGMAAAERQVDVRGTTVLIGPRQGGKNDPFYAFMVEFGTVNVAAHPFARPAWDAKNAEAGAVVMSSLTEAMLKDLRNGS